MLNSNLQQIHQNDRVDHARRLGLRLAKFDSLVASANRAYEILKELGPFYGQEEMKEPTFRITAEPVQLPKGSNKTLTHLGNDLFKLGKALEHLPQRYRQYLGNDIDFRIPPTWRIDAMLDTKGHVKVTEIECVDGATALMMAEQQAYGLQTLQESTAAKLISTLKIMCDAYKKNNDKYKIGLIRIVTPFKNNTINAKKFNKFLEILSKDTLSIDLLDATQIREGNFKPNWKQYAGILNERGFAPHELTAMGVHPHQTLTSGNYHALCRKGVFPLIFDEALTEFWIKHLGKDCYNRIKDMLIPSVYIKTLKDLEAARSMGKVVKVAWSTENDDLIHSSRGVAVPMGESIHGSDERWETLKNVLIQGKSTLIAQDFVEPAKISAFLRKKGTTLEHVNWFNRVCVKYIVDGNPHEDSGHTVLLTAAEVTLGPNVVPAGRKCAFTAAKLI